MREAFSCSRAISRNIGCVAVKEQGVLRRKRVAIAGMSGMSGMSGSGGAGDVYLLTVARLGSGAFNIQMGASVSSIGMPKVDALAAMAKDGQPKGGRRELFTGMRIATSSGAHWGPGAIFSRCSGLP